MAASQTGCLNGLQPDWQHDSRPAFTLTLISVFLCGCLAECQTGWAQVCLSGSIARLQYFYSAFIIAMETPGIKCL